MTDVTVAETSVGHVEVQFGINRWVMVTLSGRTEQRQLDRKGELASYLRQLGLLENEARELASRAWRARPASAAMHAASAREGLRSATGFGSLGILAVVLALIALYIFFRIH